MRSNTEHCMANNEIVEALNRLKVVLVEKGKTSRWLAEQLGKDEATVSKWCTNTSQPSLETLFQIAECLGVSVQELISKEKKRAVNII